MRHSELIVDFQSEKAGDLIFVAGTRTKVQAIGSIRPMAFVHDMEMDIGLSPARRAMLASALSSFGQGYIRHRKIELRGCLFHVSPGNATMEAFARTLGGQPEAGVTYRIDYTKGG